MPNTYALIRLDGQLRFHDNVSDPAKHAAPGPDTTITFTIQPAGWGSHGLHGQTTPIPTAGITSPANPIASSVVAALGGPDHRIHGNLIIGGDRVDPSFRHPVACSLTKAQEHLIHDVHRAVLRADTPQG
ncbi:hypothetical protein OG311_00345 [Streptomyces sp. NBC_01343]|uniref:hypothetical protein n=1 Tax=Streptomyces sp. NBC_01343 TaxID=2903832 RepID=UPI002E1541E9|nr:hypothetical protein OG311_00345 [Streptomyces sp. NBC_01343]